MRTPFNSPLLAISIALSLAYLPLAYLTLNGSATLCKVASIAFLAFYGVNRKASSVLIAALTFSSFGDFLLELPQLGYLAPDQIFLFGLGSFLIAHICYICLFAPRRATKAMSPLRRAAIILIAAALALMLNLLWTTLGPMKLPVTVYALALAAMAITAQRSYLRGTVAFGAILFVASDAMLAWEHFRASFDFSGPLIWSTYYLAQMLITTGVAQHAPFLETRRRHLH